MIFCKCQLWQIILYKLNKNEKKASLQKFTTLSKDFVPINQNEVNVVLQNDQLWQMILFLPILKKMRKMCFQQKYFGSTKMLWMKKI
jgi:hypothetical protein